MTFAFVCYKLLSYAMELTRGDALHLEMLYFHLQLCPSSERYEQHRVNGAPGQGEKLRHREIKPQRLHAAHEPHTLLFGAFQVVEKVTGQVHVVALQLTLP